MIRIALPPPVNPKVIGYAYGCEVFCGHCWGRGTNIDLSDGADRNAPCTACGGFDLREEKP